MMEKFKFRAFDTISGEMSPEFYLFGEMTMVGAIFAWLDHVRQVADGTCGLLSLNDLKICQATGIKGKDGNEIFAGDVVQTFVNNHYWKYVVMELDSFGSNLWACEFENNLSVNEDLNQWTFQRQLVKLGSSRDFVKKSMLVMGNIYQNPDLLNE